ncbi:MAG: hypothetical protein ACI8RZ_007119 [Myxococcota bacterium]|jgi:hypothetical protein
MSSVNDSSRARVALLGSVIVTVLLYVVPYGQIIAWPLVLLSTLAHEMGHGIAAVGMGGSFESFVMFSDASGLATWSGNVNRFERAFISAGGLIGPSVVAALCFGIGRSTRASRAALVLLGVGLILAEILVVRNLFGFGFVALIAAGSLGLGLKGRDAAQWGVLFVGVQLALSVFSRADYLFTATAQTGAGDHPSDVAHIAEALLLPYWFWGGAVGLLSVVVLVAGLASFFWPARATPSDAS